MWFYSILIQIGSIHVDLSEEEYMESVQKKLSRVRKPRVHIIYEVETGGAVVQRELPFVVGVLGDFSGNDSAPKKPLKDRKFIQIDRDNFDEVMTKIEPKLNLKVDNTLASDGSQMSVSLKFNKMEDFEPARIVDQVEPLKKLLEARNRLRDLLSKADRSEALELILEKLIKDKDALTKLEADLNTSPAT